METTALSAYYLSELAPRLKDRSIDAVCGCRPHPKTRTPPTSWATRPTNLGDKFQKSDVRTRFGSKNEILRLMAALHANGIEVIQDVVLSHTDRAGTTAGDLDQNPEPTFSLASNSGYKTFRYSSFATPLPKAADNGAAYAPRQGRWPKNYANFHPQLGHNTSGDHATPYFGPDFCYGNDADNDSYGQLIPNYLHLYPGAFSPPQSAGYSQTQARN